MWDSLVAIVRIAIFTAAHVTGGSLGSGIFLVSAAVRLALLPLTLRAAREARARSASKPSPANVLSGVIQMPLLGAIFTAVRRGLGAGVRFLWIDDLGRPDLMLAGLVTSLSVALAMASPPPAGQTHVPLAALLVSGALTLVFLWSASSALALSVGAGSAVSLIQNVILRRDAMLAQPKPPARSARST